MHSKNRRPRSADGRPSEAFRPRGEYLESRQLLAVVDLNTPVSATGLPAIATAANSLSTTGFGIDLSGPSNQTNQNTSATTTIANPGAGYSIANVGDINSDGFDDFIIGAPTTTSAAVGGHVSLGGGDGAAYLVLGSRAGAGGGNTDWRLLNTLTQPQNIAGQLRVGDLTNLNQVQTNQLNPISNIPSPTNNIPVVSFPYAGVKIISNDANSELGASVAALGTININGFQVIAIGAPNANKGSGEVYLLYANANLLNITNNTLNLDAPPSGVPVYKITTAVPNAHLGASVSSAGNLLGDGGYNLAIGAPGANLTVASPTAAGAGAVYVLPRTIVNTPPSGTSPVLINVDQIGLSTQPANLANSVIFSGSTSTGDSAGFSVANTASIDGTVFGGVQATSLVIGSPTSNNNAGTAWLAFGVGLNVPSLSAEAKAAFAGGQPVINLSQLGSFFLANGTRSPTVGPGTGGGEGAIFQGNTSFQTGYAVAGASASLTPTGGGLFFGGTNNLPDFMIGSPGANLGAGLVTLVYGQQNARSTTTRIGPLTPVTGPISLAGLPTNTAIPSVAFTGATQNDLTGSSLSPIGDTSPTSAFDDILIGAPGFASGEGTVYVIAGSATPKTGTAAVTTAVNQFTITGAAGGGAASLGTSVSGRINTSGQVRTVDGDTTPDVFIGAPGYVVNTGVPTNNPNNSPFGYTPSPLPTARSGNGGANGGAFIVEGGLVPTTPTPTPTPIPTPTPTPIPTPTPTPTPAPTGIASGAIGAFIPSAATYPFGPTQAVPTLSELSTYDYKPLPVAVAIQQYTPTRAFQARISQYFHPTSHFNQFGKGNGGLGIRTLKPSVFTRGQPIKPGHTLIFTHKVRVVPVNRQTEVIRGTPYKAPKR